MKVVKCQICGVEFDEVQEECFYCGASLVEGRLSEFEKIVMMNMVAGIIFDSRGDDELVVELRAQARAALVKRFGEAKVRMFEEVLHE